MENPWEKIALVDYEKHMRHETVGQLQCLNSLMEGQRSEEHTSELQSQR